MRSVQGGAALAALLALAAPARAQQITQVVGDHNTTVVVGETPTPTGWSGTGGPRASGGSGPWMQGIFSGALLLSPEYDRGVGGDLAFRVGPRRGRASFEGRVLAATDLRSDRRELQVLVGAALRLAQGPRAGIDLVAGMGAGRASGDQYPWRDWAFVAMHAGASLDLALTESASLVLGARGVLRRYVEDIFDDEGGNTGSLGGVLTLGVAFQS